MASDSKPSRIRSCSVAGSLAVLLVLLMAGLLAACGQQPPAPTATPTATVETAAAVSTAVQSDSVAVPSEPAPARAIGEQPQYGGTLRYDSSPPAHPDPWNVLNPSARPWVYLNFNSLVQQKFPYDAAKGPEYVPALATEWSQSPDGSKWTLKLRQGVTFHDGEVFNADDVVATFERLLDPDIRSRISARILPTVGVFLGVKKTDDSTVVLDTGLPNASAFAWISSHYVVMAPEHLVRGDRNATDPKLRWQWMHPDKKVDQTGTLAIGTGPFTMAKWDPEVEMVGQRHPNYWQRDQQGNLLPYLDGFALTRVTDATRQLARYVSGTSLLGLGTGTGLHPTNANSLCGKIKGRACYHVPYPHGYFPWFLNLSGVPEFKDERLVKAARYAVDHQTIIDIAYGHGQGFVWNDRERFADSALSVKEQYEVMPWSNPQRREEFVQKAKDLLRDAGYPNGIDLPYPLYGSCSGVFLDKFSREVDQFYRAGLRGSLECRQGVVIFDELKAGRWSIANTPVSIFLNDPGYSIIANLLPLSTPIARAPYRWEGQAELNKAFEKTQREVDPSKRNEQYRSHERYLADDKWSVFPIGYTSVVAGVHTCLRNYSPGGTWESWNLALAVTWLSKECQ